MKRDSELIEAAGKAMSVAIAREQDEYLRDALCAMTDPDAPQPPAVTRLNWRTWRSRYWTDVRAYRKAKEGQR